MSHCKNLKSHFLVTFASISDIKLVLCGYVLGVQKLYLRNYFLFHIPERNKIIQKYTLQLHTKLYIYVCVRYDVLQLQ